jgi:hypothetical protein
MDAAGIERLSKEMTEELKRLYGVAQSSLRNGGVGRSPTEK